MKISILLSVLMTLAGHVYSQNISGTVRNASGEEIIGVNVTMKGTSKGTVTDSKGHFSITRSSQTDTLLFSIWGYISQEVPSLGKQIKNVELKKQDKRLDDIRVGGYGQTKRENLTGAVDQVAVDLHAVARAQILHRDVVTFHSELRVVARHQRIVERELAAGGAPDHELAFGQLDVVLLVAEHVLQGFVPPSSRDSAVWPA